MSLVLGFHRPRPSKYYAHRFRLSARGTARIFHHIMLTVYSARSWHASNSGTRSLADIEGDATPLDACMAA